ncbi:hypothetical protein CBS9595_004210 [Malassezia furfur]|nr:hypothetical protein CBS9595_004210 [Malassezia furfur]
MALRAVRRLAPLLAQSVAPAHTPGPVRIGQTYAVVHTVLALVSLVQPTLPGPSTRPDASQALASVALDAVRAHDLAHAAESLGAMADLAATNSDCADDAEVRVALKRGIFALASATRQTGTYTMHPALALASVYDRCRAAGIVLPHGTFASIIGAMARVLPSETLVDVLDVLHPDFLAQPPGDESGLCALISAYGRAGYPERGEMLVAAYAQRGVDPLASSFRALALQQKSQYPLAAAYLVQCRGQRAARMPRDVQVGAWCRSAAVWNALVRARIVAGDVGAAHLWLERYRLLLHVKHPCRPPRTASPYLTLMHACSSGPGIRAFFEQSTEATRRMLRRRASAAEAPFRSAAVHALLRCMHTDSVVPGVAMLNFLTSFEAGRGRLAPAAQFAVQALGVPWAAHQYRVHVTTYAALFTVHAAGREGGAALRAALAAGGARLAPWSGLATPRGVLASCVQTLRALSAAPRAAFVARYGTHLLNSALDALLTASDVPAALYALQTLESLGVARDMYTYACIWRHLPMRGTVEDALAQAIEAQAPDTPDAVGEALTTVARAVEL